MTTVMINIEEGHEEELKTLLRKANFKVEIMEGAKPALLAEPESTYEKLKKIQEDIGEQELFKNIKDPSEWQREIRKEWDRDI
jgi:tRNA G10  N-methylase Trm11